MPPGLPENSHCFQHRDENQQQTRQQRQDDLPRKLARFRSFVAEVAEGEYQQEEEARPVASPQKPFEKPRQPTGIEIVQEVPRKIAAPHPGFENGGTFQDPCSLPACQTEADHESDR